LALVLGLMLLGPTFHSFLYLFAPALPTFVLLEWYFNRPSRKELLRTLVLFAGAFGLALLMISPKLACWAIFPMARPTRDFGTLPFLTGLRMTFDYSLAKDYVVETSSWLVSGKNRMHPGWGVEESAIALPPVASLLALLGLATAFRDRSQRRTAVFAIVVAACGFALSCCAPVWNAFRGLTGDNFRVASRFLGMTAFGLAVFAALGADTLFARFERHAKKMTLFALGTMVVTALLWTHAAGSVQEPRAVGDDVNPNMIWPRAAYREERDAAARINSFSSVVRYRKRRDILDGIGYTDGFLVVGNDFVPTLWPAVNPQPIVVIGIKPENIKIEHLRVKIRHMAPRSRIFLRVRMPAFGLAVVTEPPTAHVRVREQGDFLVVENHEHAPVERVVLRAEFPISVLWVVAAVFGLVGTLLGLVVLEVARRRTANAAAVTGAKIPSFDEEPEA
jgi:hypothetical protein